MIKILSIGNSFSQDAQRYIYDLAKVNGEEIKCVNLFIGGCSLRRHYYNILANSPSYEYELNGVRTGLYVSILQALQSDTWDYITLQQASWKAPFYETFQPYLDTIVDFIKEFASKAKLIIHQTWAYEEGERIQNLNFESSRQMLAAVKASYEKAAKAINAHTIIPSGEALLKANELGIEKVHRDGSHAGLGTGRYILSLTWYAVLFGKGLPETDLKRFDEDVPEEEIKIAREAVKQVLGI